MQKQKPNYRPLFFTMLLVLIAAGTVIYFTLGEAQRTLPKIKLSYFKDNVEFAQSIEMRLHLEIGQNKHFWIGYEPEKENQIDLALQLKGEIEKSIGAFNLVLIDRELGLSSEKLGLFGKTELISLKAHFAETAEIIKANKDKKILVITAAIYSTNLIKQNPRGQIFDLTQIRPMTFSMGYFPATLEDEKYNVFRCDTEDKTGTSPWGCAVLGKARAMRRKIDQKKLQQTPPLRLGLMDLTGENDYMILVGK